MISKKYRFAGKRAVERVYKSARSVRFGVFNIRVRENKQEEYRLAVVVSKKVNKSAVVRNRIRRRIFEFVRKNIAPSDKLKNKEIIITVFDDSLATMPSGELKTQLEKLFEKAKI